MLKDLKKYLIGLKNGIKGINPFIKDLSSKVLNGFADGISIDDNICNNINDVVVFILFGISVVISLLNIKIYENKKLGIILAVVSIIINSLLFVPIWGSLMWK